MHGSKEHRLPFSDTEEIIKSQLSNLLTQSGIDPKDNNIHLYNNGGMITLVLDGVIDLNAAFFLTVKEPYLSIDYINNSDAKIFPSLGTKTLALLEQIAKDNHCIYAIAATVTDRSKSYWESQGYQTSPGTADYIKTL